MRVFVESDMTVCPDGHTLNLSAGETVEGPLARYLANSGCAVTVEEDDRPAPAADAGAEPDVPSHIPGSGSPEQETTSESQAAPEQETAPEPEPAEPDAAS